MKKDIEHPKVENISVAVVKELNEEKTAEVYNVYLINQKESMIKNAMVSSKGYGENQSTGQKIHTSTLRHFIGDIEAKDYAKIEPIVEEVFGRRRCCHGRLLFHYGRHRQRRSKSSQHRQVDRARERWLRWSSRRGSERGCQKFRP